MPRDPVAMPLEQRVDVDPRAPRHDNLERLAGRDHDPRPPRPRRHTHLDLEALELPRHALTLAPPPATRLAAWRLQSRPKTSRTSSAASGSTPRAARPSRAPSRRRATR